MNINRNVRYDSPTLTAQEKGATFELLFADHMKREFGFAEAKVNVFLKGKLAARAYQVDVVGIKKLPFWRVVYVLALLVVAAGILTLAFPKTAPRVTNTLRAAGARVEKVARVNKAGVGLFAFGAAVLVLGYVGDRKSRRRVWVECKNRKSTIKRADIFKTVSSVEDVRDFAGRRRKDAIDAVWFVSSAEYDCDAVAFAKAKGVALFITMGDSDGSVRFQRVA